MKRETGKTICQVVAMIVAALVAVAVLFFAKSCHDSIEAWTAKEKACGAFCKAKGIKDGDIVNDRCFCLKQVDRIEAETLMDEIVGGGEG